MVQPLVAISSNTTINANTRYDGSNRFGDRSNEKILPVWSVSANANLEGNSTHQRQLAGRPYLQGCLTVAKEICLEGQTPKLTITKGAYDAH